MSLTKEALLVELGIPHWRARSGVVFPGAPDHSVLNMPEVNLQAKTRLLEPAPPARVDVELPDADIYLCADAGGAQERELLDGIAQAARKLRADIQIAVVGLNAPLASSVLQVRLDDKALPGLAAMLGDAAQKRPVWEALKAAVASVP